MAQTIGFTYDALSRKTIENGPAGQMGFGYDLADRRTKTNFPGAGALSIDYTYLTTGELTTIAQSATALATYGYDNLGNRTGVAFGNGTAQAFA